MYDVALVMYGEACTFQRRVYLDHMSKILCRTLQIGTIKYAFKFHHQYRRSIFFGNFLIIKTQHALFSTTQSHT